MAKSKEIKTKVMRILEKNKIDFKHYTYECEAFVDGGQTADLLGLNHEKVYKTLVTVGNSKEYFVFVIPIDDELDLKKAARAVHEKSLAMIPVKDITNVTGYVRGGCTAVGMKKQYKTTISTSAEKLDTIIVSGGRIGSQIELKPADLCKVVNGQFADVTV